MVVWLAASVECNALAGLIGRVVNNIHSRITWGGVLCFILPHGAGAMSTPHCSQGDSGASDSVFTLHHMDYLLRFPTG